MARSKYKVRKGRRAVSRNYTARGPGILARHGNGKKHTSKMVSRGPGSVYAEADMRQLIERGMLAEAAELYEKHKMKAWASPMRWGDSWYHQYKNGLIPQTRGALLP